MGQFKKLYEAAKEITRDELIAKAKEYAKTNAHWAADDRSGYSYTATVPVNSKLVENIKFYLSINGSYDGAKLKFEIETSDRALSSEDLTKYPDIQREIKKIIDKSGISFGEFSVEKRMSSTQSETSKGISPAFVKNLGKLFSTISKIKLGPLINTVTDNQKPSSEILAKFQKAIKVTVKNTGINNWSFTGADYASAVAATRKFGTSMFGSSNQVADTANAGDMHKFTWQASRFTYFHAHIKKDGTGTVSFSFNR